MFRRLVLIGLACLGGAALARVLTTGLAGWVAPALSLTSGIVLGALLRTRQRQWPPLVLAGFVAMAVESAAIAGQPLLTSLFYAALVVAEATVVAAALSATVRGPLSLSRVNNVLWLILAAGAVPLVVGLVAAVGLQPGGEGALLAAWRAWWLSSTLGLMLAGSITVAVFDALELRGIKPAPHVLEPIVTVAVAAVFAEVAFGGYLPPALRVPAFMLPVFLWAAMRLGVGGAAATLLAATLVGLWHTARGESPLLLDGTQPDMWLLRAQGAAAIAGTSLILFASVASERKQIARERAELLADLQEAGAEIKTLRGMIPICAWCHKVRDDAGFWQGLEAYVHTHTQATLSHGICPDCNSSMHSELKVGS